MAAHHGGASPGEDALRRLDAAQAADWFERAAAARHDAQAELGLIRSYMQAGEYRRALAFAAHTAGVHLDEPAGAALYAWLLHLGGQPRIAAQMLERARGRAPDDPVLAAAAALIRSPTPAPGGRLLEPPWRFAPYSPESESLPPSARVAASGVMIDPSTVLAPAAAVGDTPLWVRDGLGRLAAVAAVRRRDADIAELELERPLGEAPLAWPARDPFPGSPAYAIEFAAGSPAPAWPILRSGFLGKPNAPGLYALSIDLPGGPRGGPVFDAAGRLAGLAVRGGDGRDRLVPASRLRNRAAEPAAGAAPSRIAPDEIYERGLAVTVQVIAAR